MPSYRIARLNADFQREISTILTQMKDARLQTMLSVMRVEVTSDLSYAKVFVGAIEGAERAKEACAVLKKAEGHIRSELAKKLRIRKVPELVFVADDSVDYFNKINTIIKGFQHESDD